MPLISCVINVDTRPESSQNQEMFRGVVDREFLYDGILNKRNFLKDFNAEFIVFVDEHEPLTDRQLLELREVSDTLIIRKHNKEFEDNTNCAYFNDLNYINAISQCRGKYIFHFDGDEAAFASSKQPILDILMSLEAVDYVSYPWYQSPYPAHDDSFEGKFFASTRFFACKRETFNVSELLKCQLDYDYWKETYPVPRLCHWLEHLMSSIVWNKGKGVIYPPMDIERYAIFTWETYEKYTYRKLNNLPYEEVKNWINQRGIHYPNNLKV